MIDIKQIPTLEEAFTMLKEAEKMNEGPWVAHSMNVAESAKLIAEQTQDMDKDVAYIMGLLHDIGRRGGRNGMKHSIVGYQYLSEKGYEACARICLSHVSFKLNGKVIIVGEWNGTQEEHDFAVKYLTDMEYSDYDRLIQMCDYLALPEGCCLMEKRLVDIALRGGVSELTVPRWKSTFESVEYFNKKIGKSIYSVLPDVVENTFGM